MQDALQDGHHTLYADGEAHEVSGYHHEDVDDAGGGAHDAVLEGARLPLVRGEEEDGDALGEHEEDDEPAPDEEAHLDVVPEGDKGEDDEVGERRPGGVEPSPEG